MANENNLRRLSPSEAREYGKKGGKASGEARRRKANFRKTLNLLLTTEIDNEEWKPVLESLGVECTLESALLMAQIKMALAGDTQAAKFVAQYSGQSARAEEDLENKKADTELIKARKEAITGENENDEALDRLDQILKEVRDNAVKQETETFTRMTGFTSLSEGKNSIEYSRQYVDEASERSDVVGYSPAIDYELDRYTNDPVHEKIATITDDEIVGTDAQVSIVVVDLFDQKTSETTCTARKRLWSVIPDTEGDGTDALIYKGSFKAAGEIVKGTATTTDGWKTCTFSEA